MNAVHIFILNDLIENNKKRRHAPAFCVDIMVTQEGLEPPTL
ncbi:hypothetical protein [Selenomonas noxia]